MNEYDQVLTIGTLILAIVAAQYYGWNRHSWDMPQSMLIKASKSNFVYDILYSQAACQAKLSVLWFTHRLIGRANKGIFYPHFVAFVLLVTIVALCEVLFIIVSFVLCRYVSQLSSRQRVQVHL